MSSSAHEPHSPSASSAALVLGALGVVFGDIGTSPLYTFKECLHHGAEPADVYGIVSLLFWSLALVVTVKYVALLMLADNRGEGGIMALITLLPRSSAAARARSARCSGR